MLHLKNTLSLGAVGSSALAVADELYALLAPAEETIRSLAAGTPRYWPEYPQLDQLVQTVNFANAVIQQTFTATNEDHEVWSAFSVDAMARDVLPLLRTSVQGRAKVTLAEDSHSPLLQGNPLGLKRALLHVVRSLARTITAPQGLIDIGVAVISVTDNLTSAETSNFPASHRVVRLTLVDNGIGMDPQRIQALMQSGPEVRPLRHREDEGLRLAANIVKAHGGLLDIESHTGIGTMVRIDLPLAWPGRSADSPR